LKTGYGTFGEFSSSALLIGSMYPLRSVQMPNQARTRFFPFCGVFGYSLLLTKRLDLKNTGSLTILTDSQPHKNLRWGLGLANKLHVLCCWVIFRLIITLLLPLIAFNREMEQVIHHHSFVDRFYREKFCIRSFNLNFDDGSFFMLLYILENFPHYIYKILKNHKV
jgi:hypothetical protein